MGVIQTGAIFKGLVFDGINSKNYGVYISGNAVFNAPERDVEMIAIPGRNGTFALDNGRFHNITVTYHAGLFGDTETDFAEAISDFRNMLCARKGYCRLTDDYNPDEYRMAVYKSGLEVDVASLEAGQFDIVFECKPQRFLTSGETATAYASGATITNPTPFESHPLLACDGYGTVAINGKEMEISVDPLGDVVLRNSSSMPQYSVFTVNSAKYKTGDTISVKGRNGINCSLSVAFWDASKSINSLSVSTTPASPYVTFTQDEYTTDAGTKGVRLKASYDQQYTLYQWNYTAGTSAYKALRLDVSGTYADSTTFSGVVTASLSYSGTNEFTFQVGRNPTDVTISLPLPTLYDIRVDSTQTVIGKDVYIDLDIGEAYYIDNGAVVSLNSVVSIPAELPALVPGANSFTYDNTITTAKVTPRWWKV